MYYYCDNGQIRFDSYYLQPIYNLFHFWKDQQGGTLLKLYLFLMYIWDFQIYLTHRCSRSFHSGHLHSPKTSCIHSYFMKTFQILQSSFPSNFWHWLTITWEKNLIVCTYIEAGTRVCKKPEFLKPDPTRIFDPPRVPDPKNPNSKKA